MKRLASCIESIKNTVKADLTLKGGPKGHSQSAELCLCAFLLVTHIRSAYVIMMINIARFASVSPVADMLETTSVEAMDDGSIGDDSLSRR